MSTPSKLDELMCKLEKYVCLVPTYYAAVHLELRNPNVNPDHDLLN